ncbi:hypothetical protein [Kosakonia oryziphila]|nr:hypothetical protein [Kosakonia oryziphila]
MHIYNVLIQQYTIKLNADDVMIDVDNHLLVINILTTLNPVYYHRESLYNQPTGYPLAG